MTCAICGGNDCELMAVDHCDHYEQTHYEWICKECRGEYERD